MTRICLPFLVSTHRHLTLNLPPTINFIKRGPIVIKGLLFLLLFQTTQSPYHWMSNNHFYILFETLVTLSSTWSRLNYAKTTYKFHDNSDFCLLNIIVLYFSTLSSQYVPSSTDGKIKTSYCLMTVVTLLIWCPSGLVFILDDTTPTYCLKGVRVFEFCRCDYIST